MGIFEKMTKANKLKKAKEYFVRAVDADVKWQTEARSDFKFRDGDQWTTEEKKILEEELRPVLTFNLTKSSVDLIMGMNEDNKIVHRASPTEPTDGFLAEVLNDVADWVQETNEFELEEDSALESAAICGRGFVGIDFVPDPKKFGEIEMSEVEIAVHEVHFDPAARRKDLGDASYICWDRWLTMPEFNMRYPTIKGKRLEDIISAGRMFGINTIAEANIPQAAFEIPYDVSSDDSDYETPLDMNFYDKSKEMVRVIHMEYWDTFQRYFIWNPEAKVWDEAPEKPNEEVKAMFLEEFGQEMVVEVVQDRKVKWLQFIGDVILFDGDSPLPYGGFSIVPVFAYADVSKRTMNHFGLVRLMRDPQKEINKRWSQALNMLNQQVQPGIYAETDAFVDAQQAQQSMKEAGAITWTNAGALTGGKIKERTVPTFPNAPMQMEQFSQDIMKKITGINPDLLGQDRGRQEPGVVVRLRQQQGITLLKPLFKSYNKAKKELFKRQLAIIMAYMPDEQILRILGQNERYEVDKETGVITDTVTEMQASFRDVRNLEYNIATEESPGNMSKRMLEMTALLEMQKQGFPVDPLQIIEKMELPAREKQRWIEYIQQTQQAQSEQQEQAMQAELQFRDREIAVKEQQNQLEFMIDMAKINQTVRKDEGKLAEEFAELAQDDKHAVMEFVIELIRIANEEKMAEKEIEGKEVELQADIAKAQLDLSATEAKHQQAMKHLEEKNKQALSAQKEKDKIAAQKAKQKPVGGTNAGPRKGPNKTKP
jgi:hypothetical protein